MSGASDLFNAVVDLQAALTEVKNEPPSRDKLAAMAMQGIVSGAGDFFDPDAIAARAYDVADAMIAARQPKAVPE